MDEYDEKFAEMQKYIPFLEAMIERLQNVKDKSREIQLQKMQSLHGILSNSKRKLKIETLQRCEDVLQKLHNKVEKGNTPGLHIPNKKSGEYPQSTISNKEVKLKGKKHEKPLEIITLEEKFDETPASPSPPVSPDVTSQTAPIIIPTERSLDPVEANSKPASPDQVEVLSVKPPIIIPTERKGDIVSPTPSPRSTSSNKGTDDVAYSEWDMLEQSELQNTKNKSNWKPVTTSSHDVTSAAKLVGNNISIKFNDVKPHAAVTNRHIPTVPVPSLGGSRRLSSVLEKTRLTGLNLDAISSTSVSESIVSVSEVASPKHKDGHSSSKINLKSTTPLLVSPPPVSTEPPLSMEDLAELLNEEEGDAKTEGKNEQAHESNDGKKSIREKLGSDILKLKKDTGRKATSVGSESSKDSKVSKSALLSQEDIDRENDRRWEEVDKHIVKLTARKCLPSIVQTSPISAKVEALKSNEAKGLLVVHQPSFSSNSEKLVDQRHRSLSPSSKAEPRYADNYERHPRHARDGHDNISDKTSATGVLCRTAEEEASNPLMHHADRVPTDDRSNLLYQRRPPGSIASEISPIRLEHLNQDHFPRQTVNNQPHWPPSHPSPSTNEFCSPQWTPSTYTGMSTAPLPNPMYQHPLGMHQDMWNAMDSHKMNDSQVRPNLIPLSINPGIRPLMSSPIPRPQDINHVPRVENIRDESPNIPVPIMQQPLLSPTGFQVGPQQYRSFPPENRAYDVPFDRPTEYAHGRQSWDQIPGRSNDPPYRGEGEIPCTKMAADGVGGISTSYGRPSTPCPWKRKRDKSRNRAYNRGEGRNGFNRDGGRRGDWSRDGHVDWDSSSRFGRENRAISDRDPRIRVEHGMLVAGSGHSRENSATSVRDPRLAKDKHQPISKKNNKESVCQERDPRKRSQTPTTAGLRKTKDKFKSQKSSSEGQKRDSDNAGKQQNSEKAAKDTMTSPLESLYGVIDTKGKVGQGYGLQKFKIPKIKRPESQSSKTSSKSSENKKNNSAKKCVEKDDATAAQKEEVTSSSDSLHFEENWDVEDDDAVTMIHNKEGNSKEEDVTSQTIQSTNNSDLKFEEADSITKTSLELSENAEMMKKDAIELEGSKLKDEVTQEWIEALIRKSLEFGEGKKLFEQAKLIQKLGEALHAKKFKKIKRIIESESESSSSDVDETVEMKKSQSRKKRRVIVSDSSDEESLADRLGILSTVPKVETSKEETEVDSKTPLEQAEQDARKVEQSEEIAPKFEQSERQLEEPEKLHEQTEEKRQQAEEQREDRESPEKVQIDDAETNENDLIEECTNEKDSEEKEQFQSETSTNSNDDQSELFERSEVNSTNSVKNEENSEEKEFTPKSSKPKAKRRNSLEMLQEDIREMFISEGVVTATGHRMCRILKENQAAGPSNASAQIGNVGSAVSAGTLKKEESSSKEIAEETIEAEDGASNVPKSKKVIKARIGEESQKARPKGRKQAQRVTRQRSKELPLSSDSEEDQPLALRTEMRSSEMPVLPKEKDNTPKSQESETLRRSKRVLLKESVKEPRVVVEKTNIVKVESSKVMFDSSSDESFGIDVAELTAAVDISLSTEKQPTQSQNLSQSSASKKKPSVQSASRKNAKRKGGNSSTEGKVDDAASVTSEGNAVSDLSVMSSTNSEQKDNPVNEKSTSKITDQELLSDVLIGLVPSTEKNISTPDKGSDVDVDEDIGVSSSTEQNQKKISAKKKKKKCNWQMGILSKKKRKKVSLSNPPESDQVNIEAENAALKSDDTSLREDKPADMESKSNKSTDSSTDTDVKKDILVKKSNVDAEDTENDDKRDDPPKDKESLCKTDPIVSSNDEIVDLVSTRDNTIAINTIETKKPCASRKEKADSPTVAKTQIQTSVEDISSGEVQSEDRSDESSRLHQAESKESTVNATPDKLSIFVCPPELENKEVEIQLERKRKMQEIVENIGIKLHKDVSKKGQSIIDKLKDKMKSNTHSEDNQSSDSVALTSSAESNATKNCASGTSSVPTKNDSNATESSVSGNDTPSKETNEVDKNQIKISDEKGGEDTVKIELDVAEVDNPDVTIQDPLFLTEQETKDCGNELETSDNETTRESATIYESDSSSEQSDNEISTDVNTLLKETSSIVTSSKDPMLTTIQRLAAQLQSTAKPFNKGSTTEHSLTKEQGDSNDTKRNSANASIPKPPNVIPISSIKRFTKSQDSMYQKTPKETVDSNSQRKNFIRLRRLSGDMLSVPGPPLDSQEETSSSCAGSQSDISGDVLQTDTEEECSFLKIENVVSLAPCTDNDESESPIINDIRKAVETLPIRSKGISVLKKSSPPLILKRINSVSIGQPIAKKNLRNILPAKNSDTMKLIPVKSVPATTPIATNTSRTSNYVPIVPKPKIFQIESNQLSFPVPVAKNIAVTTAPSPPSNLNYKILKVVRAPSILKTKENTAQSIAIKLKSSDAYSVMLRPSKLSHLYKCMGRDCRYTTDSVTLYYQHYTQHDTLYNKKKSNPPYDYQKCAYCYMALNDWTQMKSHMEEKHAHCRYQCNYCFYRAIAPSYVQIHQTISHPGNRIGVLLGKLVKELPTKEEINRRDFVQPFICQQECGKYFYIPEAFAAHLKSMHSVPGAIFKCNLCHTACTKIDQLISHYKIHGLYKFQCLYCSNGADTLNTMINHLSMFHCNRLPQILERSLPPQATKDKDIIEQLIIRTPEDSTKLFSEPFNVKCCNPKDKQESNANDTINYDSTFDNGCTESVSNETELANDDSSIEIRTSVSNVDLSGASSKTIPDLTPISKYVPNKASTSLDENTNEKTYFHEPELELLSYANEDVNAVDPLGFPSGLDCPDEFVNINLLDNPDFLKNLHDHSDSSSSVINKYASSEAKGEEDSDVEILDNIDECVKSTTNKPKDEATDKDNSDTAQIVQAKSNDNQDSVASSDKIDDSIASNDKSGNSLKLFRDIEQPLTLEDIKDTGFQGTRLYKCGYENCDYSAETAVLLRTHAKDCTNVGPDKSMCCTHCGKRFVKIGFLLEHLKIHGLKRFGCSLCTMRCSMSYQAMTHMRTKHKSTNSKLIPADPENPSADGLFVVHPITLASDRRGKKRKAAKSEKDPDKLMNLEKSSFSPDEIEALPRQAIYNREVQCAVCPYTTKVRTNIIRHLRLHAKDQTVPETGPVNPVPCLDKKERMFDKMVNLASSSHQNGRMGGKPKEPAVDKEENSIPKFVPEHKRYVCSVAECNYLTVDEAMLRYHLKALHSEEPYFRCPHCPSHGQDGQNVAIDKMGVHLKMHDTRLYKCSHCNHHHYHRHVVERHLTDKHPEKRPFVKVIRELENTENVQQATADEADEEVPDPDGNHWKCNICDYKCVYKAEMITHASVSHDEKSQFKCTACSFKTSGKILFDQHISSKHSGDLNADYIMVYQRIKGINKRCSDAAEQGTQDEPFDTTPLWRRDMPRVRHIRGILLEEEDNKVTASDATAGGGGRPGKRKSDTEQVHVKVSKFKSGKSSSPDEAKQLKEKSKRSLSCEKVSEQANGHHPPTNPAQDKSDVPVNSLLNISDKVAKGTTKVDIDTSLESNDSSESDVGRFGPYGKPDFNMYVCTICNRFKTKYKHDMRDHLFRELKYARWRCKGCGFLSVNRNALLKHFTKHHNGERPDHAPLTPDDAIEDWVGTLLRKQTDMMKKLLLSLKYNTENKNPMANSSQSKISSNARVTKRGAKTDKNSTPDSTKSVVKADLSVSTAKTTSATNNDTNNDTDSGDNDNLVIDIKDDSPAKESEENISESNKDASKNEQDKPLTCKHCKMKFTRWRGLKLHVQITHLKRLGYLCPYCDRSTNSGTLMRQHIRSKHPGCIEKIVSNPAVGEPELSNEFWEKEYGIICPKRRRKRKRKTSVVAEADNKKGKGDDNEPVVQEMCNLCDFTAINCAGLKVHMRIHANQNTLKCKYCTFSGSLEAELWEHWEINHPELPFDVTDLSSSLEGPSPAGAAASEKPTKKRYADSSKPMYSCFYCSVCSHNLESVKNHWSSVHKSSKTMAGLSKCKPYVPFRYKKIQVSAPSAQTAKRIANAEAKSSNQSVAADGTAMPPKRTSSSATQEEGGWICHWCNELCNSKSETKSHQTMFHSHLPFHFKRQDGQKIRSGYTCPECPFTTNFVNEMKNHVAKHIDLFKCKYCEKTYGNLNEVEAHNITEHPESELKVENVTNYEVLLEKLMGRVIWNGNEQIKSDVVKQEACTTKVRRIHAVAKKSTTKSTLRLHGGVSKIKAVARKSTNPLPRYPFGMRFSTTECKNDDDTVNKKDNKPFSFYGRPSSPINLEQLRTYMVIGGHRMQVNCTTLAQLININPQIVVKDIKSDIGSNPAHTNFKY